MSHLRVFTKRRQNGAYGIICVKTNALTTNLFILVVIILTLMMNMDESNEYYVAANIDLDENLGVDESHLVGYDKFEDTKVTSEDFISIENLDFIEEDLSKLLKTVIASLLANLLTCAAVQMAEAYSEPSKTSKIEFFAKAVKGGKIVLDVYFTKKNTPFNSIT